MYTITLFDYIKGELIKQGFNEFVDDEGQLIFFDDEHQFMTKILLFDEDIIHIIDKLFTGMGLTIREHDHHFKQTFVSRFLMREINRQTIEAFQLQLLTTFLSHEKYINQVYQNSEKFLTESQTSEQHNQQENTQETDGNTTTDNRQAYAELPQNNVHLDLDSTIMTTANDNTISRNKQNNTQEVSNQSSGVTTSNNQSYQLDNLMKSRGLLKSVFDDFDRKCFLQVW